MKKGTLLFFGLLLSGLSASAQSPAAYVDTDWKAGTVVLRSPNNRFKLSYQTDGNLVLYKDGNAPIWSTSTMGKPSSTLSFQGDGNLVLYNNGTAVWGAQCHGKGGNWIYLQDDGNLVVYTADNRPIWASGTAGK